MTKMLAIALLLCAQTAFAENPVSEDDDLDQVASNSLFYDFSDSLYDEQENESDNSGHLQVGDVEIDVEVEEPDFFTQCQEEWKGTAPVSNDDREPKGSVSFKWSKEW